jgi:hypothetical protein
MTGGGGEMAAAPGTIIQPVVLKESLRSSCTAAVRPVTVSINKLVISHECPETPDV